MIRLLAAVFLFAGFNAAADTEVPHTFQEGEVIDAQKFNEDFNALEAAIDANADSIEALPMPPTDCTTRQIIKWNGSAWVCSSLTHVYKELSGVEGVIPCPAGKKVTGGGCDMDMAQCDQLSSVPLGFNGLGLPEFSAWYCSAGGSTGANDQCELNFGYAICQ